MLGPLAAAVSLAHATAAGHVSTVVLERGPATATVREVPPARPDPALLEVSVTAWGRTSTWRYRGLAFDPDGGGAPTAEILRAKDRDYLFVHAYSDGPHRVWSLLVFDLQRLRPVGARVGSQGPISVVANRHGCAVGAVVEPISLEGRRSRARAVLCFDGKRFIKNAPPTRAPPSRAAAPERPPRPPNGAPAPG